ncbi:MAG: hypothetical protein DRI98_13960, partial [Bacteroidetes bacterium]
MFFIGTGTNGRLYRCLLSTDCDASGDFTNPYDSTQSYVESVDIDQVNGVLYALIDDSGEIVRCLTSTDCNTSGDFAVIDDLPGTLNKALIVDQNESILYIGSSDVYRSGGFKTSFYANASTSNFTVDSNTTLVAPPSLSISGHYTNNGDFTDNSGTINFNGSSAQTLSGDLNGTEDDLNHVVFSNSGTKTLGADYSSFRDFTINPGASVVGNIGRIYISGNYTQNGLFDDNGGRVNLSGSSAQTISGTMNTTSTDFSDLVMYGGGTKTFSNDVSATDYVFISAGTTVLAPSTGTFTIGGDYSNNGTFTAGSGTTTFNGTTLQTATGTMTGTSAFNNLELTNTATTTFSTPVSVTSHFVALQPNSVIVFADNATTTLNTARISGTAGNEIKIRSDVDGQASTLDVTGSYSFDFLDVQDSYGCPSGTITAYSSIEGTGNTCWSFPAVTSINSSVENHFYVGQATTTLDTITVTEGEGGGDITSSNNIRIAIDTATTSFKFDKDATLS